MEFVTMAKKFISFLGRGNTRKPIEESYDEGIYIIENHPSKATRFVQEALIDYYCKDFTEDDTICMCLTEEVQTANWPFLKEILDNKNLKPQIQEVPVAFAKTEDQLWQLFNTLYQIMDTNDELYFDITHSFRYLPMFFLAVMNYAKYLKNISVKGIFYGNWEARTGINAPVLDITPLFDIMEWSNAADAFTSYGNTDKIFDLVKPTAQYYKGTKSLAQQLSKFADNLKTVRGTSIYKNEAGKQCLDIIKDKDSSQNSVQAALKPLFNKIKKNIEDFNTKEEFKFIPAVEYCIRYGMYQQAITLLQEGIITFFAIRAGYNLHNREQRELISRYINSLAKDKVNSHENKKEVIEVNDELHKLLDGNSDFIGIWNAITDKRNDINHGGFNDNHVTNDSSTLIIKIKALVTAAIQHFKEEYDYKK